MVTQAAMNIWTEHRNPEGRTYWFNTGTRESVWEKPDDLKTPFERALNQTKWKEYFSGGRKYYYNTDTKESKWDMPDELLLVLEKVEKESAPGAQPSAAPAQITAPGFTPVGSMQGAIVPMGGADPSSSNSASQPNGQNGVDLSVGAHTGVLPLAPTSILPARPNLPDDPVIPHNGFATIEEGEKAFMHLLRKAGVDANWTWDQTMRAIITDPLYKALNTLAEKKAAWEKFTTALKAKEHEEREARLSKLRPAIRNMLRGNPNVFHYTTFPTADKLFSQHPIWQQAKVEAERRLIFEEYVAELKQRDVQESRAARARSVAKVVNLFKELNVDVVTRWRTAHNLVLDSPEWNEDAELRKLPTLDILLAFEDYSRVREREYEDQMRKAQVEKTRKERKAREAFKVSFNLNATPRKNSLMGSPIQDLLQGLVDSRKIRARSKWKEVYPSFTEDQRYLSMLGNPGSNPLELFWDVVDILDQELDRKIALVEAAIERYNAKESEVKVEDKEKDVGFAVSPETTEEEFRNVVKEHADEGVNALTKEDLNEIYTTLHDAAVKKQAEEKRRAERKQRHLQDDLRYAMKKLSEPLDIALPYEEIVPLIQHLPEYQAVEDDEGRRAAFAKYVKRQKERMREVASEDGASTTSRKRKEPVRDHRDGDRDRDRGDRDREREKERDKDRDRERDRDRDREPHHRERERDRDRAKDYDRVKEYDRDARSSRHHRYDERRSSRDYGRSERDKDDKDRDGYKSSKHSYHRDDARRKDKDDRKYGGRDWDDAPVVKVERERSASVYKEDAREKRDVYEDRIQDDRAEKRPRYDREHKSPAVSEKSSATVIRAETPEEGEI
ncbi:hypothetical protein D9615_003571 [Tricholomella constricta]|uniref:WW domain-containing protein n=1 Tax=Tricholomella constricta TaxID=117010 RepID=A0A8H5HHQ9_9AGAR|nr:hypothetical protein D9615_003571 [Tricholomella constricta]